MGKLVFWDTENTGLEADFGTMISFGSKVVEYVNGKPKPGKVEVKSLLDFRERCKHCHTLKDSINDLELVRYGVSVLKDADIWVTWYGKRYDVPFLQTRLLEHRKKISASERILPTMRKRHIDGWEISRYRLKLRSNRLKTVTEFLGIHQKTPILPSMWKLAKTGDSRSIKYVNEHCYHDVLALEEAYDALKPLIESHPNLSMLEGKRGACAVCQSTKIAFRGEIARSTNVWKQGQCMSCGKWLQAPIGKTGKLGAWR